MDFDAVVIGGGIAGVSAALEAAARGERVAVVRAGPGATALTSGAWWGPLPDLLARALTDSALPYLPVDNPLPHPHGESVACTHAAASHAQLRVTEGAVVVGIAGLAAFPAAALARMWGAPEHLTLALPETPPGGWSPVSLAARLDREPELLGNALRAAAPARAILPAVLGFECATWQRVADAAGVPLAEALGVPPSVPGWRLDRALLAALERAAVPLISGRVTERVADGARLHSVRVVGDDIDRTLTARDFVLATGRFVGGGITAADVTDAVDVARGRSLRDAPLVERALGCDVWIDHLGERFTRVQPVPLTDPARAEPQPLLQAGVHVDAQGRPVSLFGSVHYQNVTARGGVIAQTSHGLGAAASRPQERAA